MVKTAMARIGTAKAATAKPAAARIAARARAIRTVIKAVAGRIAAGMTGSGAIGVGVARVVRVAEESQILRWLMRSGALVWLNEQPRARNRNHPAALRIRKRGY